MMAYRPMSLFIGHLRQDSCRGALRVCRHHRRLRVSLGQETPALRRMVSQRPPPHLLHANPESLMPPSMLGLPASPAYALAVQFVRGHPAHRVLP